VWRLWAAAQALSFEDRAEPPVALVGLAGATLAAGDVVARAQARPGGQVGGGREPGHIDADLGDDALGGAGAHPGDGVEMVPGLSERGYHPFYFAVKDGDHGLELLEVVQGQTYQQAVMGAEAPVEGLFQLRDLGAQPAPGQLGQHLGIAFTGHQGP
jgi:hypothetical protein